MKTTISFTLIMLSVFSYAQQSEYNYLSWEFQTSEYSPIQYQPAENVEKIEFNVINKKNKEKKYIKEYNPEGKLVNYSKIDEEGSIVPISKLVYDKNNNISVSKSYNKGKLSKTTYRTYLETGKLAEVKKEDSKGKIIFRNVWEYNDDNCLTKSIRYKGNGKVDKRWVYEYSEPCNKSKTTLYKSNGKVQKTWSYACKEEGQILEKRKNEAQVCTWEESTNDYLIKVYQTFDDKGKIRKNISKYTKADTLIVEHIMMDGNDVILNQSSYDKTYDKPLIRTGYNKGKKTYESIYKYENDLVIYHSSSYKNKLTSKYEYTYKNNLLTEQKIYNKKGDLSRTIKLTY